jgi:hypothetical protein
VPGARLLVAREVGADPDERTLNVDHGNRPLHRRRGSGIMRL